MSPWIVRWALTIRTRDGLREIQDGRSELAGHFPPDTLAAHAASMALAETDAAPDDVLALVIRIHRAAIAEGDERR